jgi:hypothetical protein
MRTCWVIAALALAAGPKPARAQSSGPANVYVFPLFADGTAHGTSYRAVLTVARTGATDTLQCTLTQRNTSASFTGVDGYTYSADVLDAGFSPPALTQLTLDRYLPWEILRTHGEAPLKAGYAKLSCPDTVQTQLQLSLFGAQNNKLGEATILPAARGTSFRFLIDTRDRTRLGFSLANDSPAAGQFAVIARDRFNYEVDRAYDMIEAWSQVSRFVDEVIHLPADFAGTVEIVGLSGNQYYAVGLQFTGFVFTAIQPLVRDTPVGY